MLSAQFKLNVLDGRPQFKTDIFGIKLNVLLDTGAVYPVWTSSETILTDIFGLTAFKKDIPVSGFGGTVYGNSYRLPLLILGDFVYHDLFIVCSELRNAPCDLILSATMFKDLCLTINFTNLTLHIHAALNDNQSFRNPQIIGSDGNPYYLYNELYSKEELERKLLMCITDKKTSEEAVDWYMECLNRMD